MYLIPGFALLREIIHKFANQNFKKIVMNKTIFSILILVISSCNVFAQIEATTTDGKKVLLFDDGFWQYKQVTKSIVMDEVECFELVSTKMDEMTGESLTGSKEPIVVSDDGDNSGFVINILKRSKSIIFSFTVNGVGGCIEADSKINIVFRDYTRLDLINDGEFNCDSKFSLYFGGIAGKDKQLEFFRKKEVKTMRIWTSESFVEKEFSPEQSKQLMNTVNCLIRN